MINLCTICTSTTVCKIQRAVHIREFNLGYLTVVILSFAGELNAIETHHSSRSRRPTIHV